MRKIYLLFASLASSYYLQANTIQTEAMTLAGPYAGTVSSPFAGVALYGNGDKASITAVFDSIPGNYLVQITGASSNASDAGVSLYIDQVKVKTFVFTGTNASLKEAVITLNTGINSKKIELILENDNGSNDTYLDKITITYQGKSVVVTRKAPVVPSIGAYNSGNYRNLFVEAGYKPSDVQTKVDAAWQQLFYGSDNNQRVYYPVGTDEAYILDVGNNDVRSEGMSYGMMIAVQLDKKSEFDRLWKWAKKNMQHASGARKGYFAWQVSKDGVKLDPNPASDGEEYFATALFMAANRWGNGTTNYCKEANYILRSCLNKENGPIQESVVNMFNANHLIVFTPYANAATFSDPSYHLPAFYELWAVWADTANSFWKSAAIESRKYLQLAAHPTTGLMPDYANFDGTPTGGAKVDFRFDAWRCAMNVAVDQAWFAADTKQITLNNKILGFFNTEGIGSYGNQYTLAGTKLSSDHSPGLVSCNAAGALASNKEFAWDFVDELWNTAIPSGQWRYYDGMLYMLGLLNTSGNFKVYKPGGFGCGTVTALENETANKVLNVYPNPFTDKINISKNANWVLKDIKGTEIKTGSSTEIETASLSKGMYILQLENGSAFKLIK